EELSPVLIEAQAAVPLMLMLAIPVAPAVVVAVVVVPPAVVVPVAVLPVAVVMMVAALFPEVGEFFLRKLAAVVRDRLVAIQLEANLPAHRAGILRELTDDRVARHAGGFVDGFTATCQTPAADDVRIGDAFRIVVAEIEVRSDTVLRVRVADHLDRRRCRPVRVLRDLALAERPRIAVCR